MATGSDAAYAASVAQVRRRVDEFAAARFAVGDHRDADLKVFLASVLPVVLAGRRQVSALTDAYLSRKVSTFLGRKVAPRGPIDTALLRGVAAAEVYRRPFQTVWWKLSLDLPYAAAVSAGAARLTDIVMTDMQLAKTTTAQQVLNVPGVQSYVRVLGGKPDCDLCIEASQNTYSTADLMPIHPGCDCGVEPSGEAPSVSSDDVVVNEHGEYGPTLGVAGQHFDGPAVAN